VFHRTLESLKVLQRYRLNFLKVKFLPISEAKMESQHKTTAISHYLLFYIEGTIKRNFHRTPLGQSHPRILKSITAYLHMHML
jgi:hypothetical protein